MTAPAGAAMPFLLLAACSCSTTVHEKQQVDTAPVTHHVPAGSVHFDATAGRQIAELTWARQGQWMPVTLLGDRGPFVGFAARDRYGTRIITVNGTAGYAITKIDLNCKVNLAHLNGTRTAGRDDVRVDGRAQAPTASFAVPGAETKRLCASGEHFGRTEPQQVVQQLRSSRMVGQAPPSMTGVPDPSEIAARLAAAKPHNGKGPRMVVVKETPPPAQP